MASVEGSTPHPPPIQWESPDTEANERHPEPEARHNDPEVLTSADEILLDPTPREVFPTVAAIQHSVRGDSQPVETESAVAELAVPEPAESPQTVDEPALHAPSIFEGAMELDVIPPRETQLSVLDPLSMAHAFTESFCDAPESNRPESDHSVKPASMGPDSLEAASTPENVILPNTRDLASLEITDAVCVPLPLSVKDDPPIEAVNELREPRSPLMQHEPMDVDMDHMRPANTELLRVTDETLFNNGHEVSTALRKPPDDLSLDDIHKKEPNFTPSKHSEPQMASFEQGLMKSEPIDDSIKKSPLQNAKSTEFTSRDLIGVFDIVPPASVEATGASDGAIAGEPSESELSEVGSSDPVSSEATHPDPTPVKSALSHLIGESRHSFASSASALTERSGLSSKPPSVSSKATTPLDAGSPREALSHPVPVSTFQPRSAPRIHYDVRPRVSIPTDLTSQEYAMECIEAAENSRLNPYALHQEEYRMLRAHISHAQVTTYLNIRNGVLRLWVRNPQIAVTRGEAIGCAKDTRWFDVANVCFDWLVRRGFINYGCVEIRQQKNNANKSQLQRRRTVVVIGAGFSGLGCARQLEGLFLQYSKRFRDMGEEPPRVIVLEGRSRVGGRVYSRAFNTLPDTAPGVFRGKRFTAEMGGMIITGFDRGNPLNILLRGQLGLPYHCLRSDMSLYDTNGTAVDPLRDQLVEHLFNACLDRVSEYKFKTQPSKLIEGNHDLMDEGRDSSAEGHKTIALVEETTAALPHAPPVSEQNVAPQVNLVPVSTDRMTGKVHVEPGTPGSTKAAFKARSVGWTLKAGVSDTRDVELDTAANHPRATLGSVVDEALMQHKDILDLNAQDFRLLNWHIANLEYSNATNLNRLSIKGWDIDAGNEWEGKHTMVVGGYQSVARGVAMLPAPLDIRHKAAVKRIRYAPEGSTGPARIDLENGQHIQADHIVNTIPLGVLKHGNIEFQPPLPSWKREAIDRLGFGVLNKVILVYKEAFWDKDRDIFGMLQTPTNRLSLNQKDYAPRRGRFFQWFNVTNTTGMPCLLALMAGDAGYNTEITPNDELIAEATEVLRMRYGARVAQPLEAIVTRWESDRFARGSYSNAGVEMQAEDYQIMARSIGNLHFAGEHTIVTHPATVHGAYLSGLRAASEVLDSILGPIEIPTPLVLPRETAASLKRKAQEENKDPARARLEAYEMEITEHIHSQIGYYPLKPAKIAGNPYLLFNKAHYEEGRRRCEEGRRAGKGKPSPNEVRTMTSKMWKEAPPEIRKPFEDQAEEQKRLFAQALKDWTEAAAKWEREAIALRERYVKEHPSVPGPNELAGENMSLNGQRRAKRVESYAEEDSDSDMN